jgi:glucose-6-phosphate isomerase
MWDWVGGRTSELSAVGLLPAALQGLDVNAMLDGAARMDRLTRRTEPDMNPAALLALAWHHAGDGKGRKDMVILPYRDRLALFSRYLQQLVMESLGKEKDLDGNVVHQGIAVYGNKGSTDQHAYVQQLRDGIANFFVTFIEVLRDRDRESIEVEEGITTGDYLHGFLLGTRRALHESGRPSMTVTIGDVSPFSVGMLIALYERAVGLYASLVNINAYHQPGVEAGKKAAAAVLSLQTALLRALEEQGANGATCEELAAAAGAPEEVETVFMVLERLATNPVRGVVRQAGTTAFDARYRLLGAGNARL